MFDKEIFLNSLCTLAFVFPFNIASVAAGIHSLIVSESAIIFMPAQCPGDVKRSCHAMLLSPETLRRHSI